MGDVIVHLATATICFLNACHPALIGVKTPKGEFPLVHMRVMEPGYGGDLLAFEHHDNTTLAIHRLYHTRQRREARIVSGETADRQGVTAGCINIEPAVYEALVDCCSKGSRLTITD